MLQPWPSDIVVAAAAAGAVIQLGSAEFEMGSAGLIQLSPIGRDPDDQRLRNLENPCGVLMWNRSLRGYLCRKIKMECRGRKSMKEEEEEEEKKDKRKMGWRRWKHL